MHSRLLILVLFLSLSLLFQAKVKANEPDQSENQVWIQQLQETYSQIKKTSLTVKHSQILKTFRAELLTEINSTKDMSSPIFEKKLSLFNSMNALFLDKFQKSNCPKMLSRWNLLRATASDYSFEDKQVEAWLSWICR